jgi:hypothetical protein
VANILEENACQKENMIATVAQVGRISNVKVMSKIKTNLEQTDNPEAMSSMRKSKAYCRPRPSTGRRKFAGPWGCDPEGC